MHLDRFEEAYKKIWEEEASEYDVEPSRKVKKHVVRATNEKVSLPQGSAKPAADKSSRKSIGSSRIDASASTRTMYSLPANE